MSGEQPSARGHRSAEPARDRARARLTASEEQFRLLVESVKDYAIFMLDRDGNVATWNTGAALIKGYAEDEILGEHFSVFYTPEDRAAHKPEQLLALALRDGRVEDEGWRVRKDGSRFWGDVVITALRDAAGGLVGFGKVTRDLSARRDMEQRLREAEQRLSTTLYSIGDGVLAVDEHARVTIINRVAQALTGWTEQEAIGRHITEVFPIINHETRAKVPNPILRVLQEGVVLGLANHTMLIARDGTERPIADSGAPIRDALGRTRGAVLVFRDVSQEWCTEEALRQSEERLRLMIASVRDYAIYMLDAQGHVVSWNSGAESIKGYKEAEILGAHFSRFFSQEDVAADKPARELEIAAREGRFEDEAWRVRKDGSHFWASVIVNAVRDASGQLVGFAKVTRDLTDRRKREQERLRLAQAREGVRLRDEFLSIASHELKTPLTALQLQLQGILDQRTLVDERLARKIEKAAHAGDRLGDLVESLFDVSRITSGVIELDYQSFDLVDAARDVIELLRKAAAGAHCDVSLHAPRPVVGSWDRIRVEQMLTNLLSNAFKHAAGAPVVVKVSLQGQIAHLEVRDSGPGLRMSDPARLFARFERGSGPNSGGLGLGLYVARQVAEAHGGTITAAAIEGGGARFEAKLPVTPEAASV
ncbi:MAG TPA: PAS domain S-box protein [Polyangiaceae bacterium]|nr:PAS domain S-box protein [Polyangiaceae bacterium]